MKSAALVPVRRLADAKRRLRKSLPAHQVEALGRLMLEDVLRALLDSPVDGIFVLTEDPLVAATAHGLDVEVLSQSPDPGLNATLDLAENALGQHGFEASVAVPADLPLLRSEHVACALERCIDHEVVLVPAADGGTALLVRKPMGVISAGFGPESAARHAHAARVKGLSLCWLDSLDLGARLDLDTLEDAHTLLAHGQKSRTLDLLREILT